jgi:hypothetical protein
VLDSLRVSPQTLPPARLHVLSLISQLRSTAAAKFLDNGAKEEGRGEGEAYSGTIQVQLEGNALGAEVQQQTFQAGQGVTEGGWRHEHLFSPL